MLCEKCGKNNSDSVTVCKHCGALMPPKASCGGFSDILSYEVKPNAAGNNSSAGSGYHSYDADETTKKLNALEQEMNVKFRSFKRKIKSASWFAGLGVAVAVLAVTSSFLYNPYEKEIESLKEEISVLQKAEEQDRIAAAQMPKGDLEKELNAYYSVSSERVKESAEKWKKVKDAPVVPEEEAMPSDLPAEAGAAGAETVQDGPNIQ